MAQAGTNLGVGLWEETGVPEGNPPVIFNGNEIYACSDMITRKSNPPISKLNIPYNEFTSVWSMFPCDYKYIVCTLRPILMHIALD